jgi:glycosyltransferase involved in cell wall biosynthesis
MAPAVTPDLSVVIPVFNEAPNLEALHREFTDTLEPWGRTYELILVDDGSTDGSFDILTRIQAGDSKVRVIQLRRNFGQTAAFAAGFAAARGRVIVTSDGDLQTDAADVPRLVARLESGFDVVCGWRKDRKDAFLMRRLPSIVANRLISAVTGVRLSDYGCSLKAFQAEVVKPLRLYGELHRFIPALVSDMGVRIAEEPVSHRVRQHGQSKYGISRTVRVIVDLLTVKFLLTYSTRPLQMFGPPGLLMGVAGVGIMGYLAYLRLFAFESIADRPLLLFGMLLAFAGMQLVTVGLLAEMQARTYHESQGKAVYVVRQVLETPDEADS